MKNECILKVIIIIYYYWIWKEYILTKLENAPPLFVGTKMQI